MLPCGDKLCKTCVLVAEASMFAIVLVSWMYVAASAVGSTWGSCENLRAGLDSCVRRYGLQTMVVREIPWFHDIRELHTLCCNLEEVLFCLGSMFDQCDGDQFSDLTTYRDTFTLVCANPEFSMTSYNGCIDELLAFYDGACPTSYREGIQVERQMAPADDIPAAELCRISENLHECISFNVTTTCVGSYGEFLRNLLRSRFTPPVCRHIASTCGNQQMDMCTYIIVVLVALNSVHIWSYLV